MSYFLCNFLQTSDIMKIRKSFVSNSSSCSFSCVIRKADYKKAIATLTETDQQIIALAKNAIENKNLGDIILVTGQLRDNPRLNHYSYYDMHDKYPDLDDYEVNTIISDAINHLVDAMRKFDILYDDEER
jgi:hypothetical protein